MKKFLAIVMCLAMALSMMTVVSFAAGTINVGANGAITAEPGAIVEIPVYFSNADGSDLTISINEFYANVPAGINYELVAGAYSLDQVYVDVENAQRICVYDDAGKTIAKGTAAFTIKLTAPAEAGEYVIDFEEYGDTCFLMDADFNLYEDVTVEDIVLTVEAPVTEPTVEATKVEAADENGQPVALYILQPKNATTYGIKYVGENAEYKGVKFASLAPASDAMAAVKVIGLDDTFEAYAE